jgi:drug/metabolite transporter (DMT)-like permease
MSKELMARHASASVSAVTTLIGTLMLLGWVLPQEGMPPTDLPGHIWISMLILGAVTTTLTTLLWNYGLGRISAGRAAIFINLEPVVGTLLGVFLLGDRLGAYSLLGGALIVVAAVIVSMTESRES